MRRLVAVTAVAALAALGCTHDDGVSDVTGASTTTFAPPGVPGPATVGPLFRPRFVTGDCVGTVPHVPRVRCGWLVTREDRTDTSKRQPTVRLPVAIVATSAADPQPDPVVYLAGGPGEPGLDAAATFLDEGYGGDRDVIVFDQRGAGASVPSLDCPEVAIALQGVFATTLPATEEQRPVARAFGVCHDRLVGEGIDLGAFDTEASADDVEDLRTALGLEQVNVYGVSYGTTLALTALRRHPASIRSVVLDAVFPTTVASGPAEVVANARRALNALADACGAAAACGPTAAEVRSTLERVVKRLDREPHRTTITDPATGRRSTVRITGADLLAGAVQALYRTSLIPALPGLLAALDQGDDSAIDSFASQGISQLANLSEGMAVSVQCADRARVPTAGDLAAATAADPMFGTLALVAAVEQVCPEWEVPPASAAFNQPVRSAVRTLVLSGAFDPVTPPSNGPEAARALSRATVVELASAGHGAVFSTPCGAQLFDAFLAEPGRRLDTGCADEPPSPWED